MLSFALLVWRAIVQSFISHYLSWLHYNLLIFPVSYTFQMLACFSILSVHLYPLFIVSFAILLPLLQIQSWSRIITYEHMRSNRNTFSVLGDQIREMVEKKSTVRADKICNWVKRITCCSGNTLSQLFAYVSYADMNPDILLLFLK